MAKLKKYDLSGKSAGEFEIDDMLLQVPANSQMIKDCLIAQRRNARQWSANTQTRSEVNHSKKKPHPQKGTGNARQGFLGCPQFRGGGRVFAPRPKFDQHVRINKKEKRSASRYLFSQKIAGGAAHILTEFHLEAPKTKAFYEFFKALNLSGKRILFLFGDAEEKTVKNYDNLVKSLRNIPRLEFGLLRDVNVYDLAVCHEIILMEPALEELKIVLGGK